MKKKRLFQVVAVLFGLIGVLILGATLYPLVSYELISREKFPSLISPLAEDKRNAAQYDYTKASNWFIGGEKQADYSPPKVAYYNLTIPALRIEDDKADAVILCGDITNFGSVNEARYLLSHITGLRIPIMFIPGNCDPLSLIGVNIEGARCIHGMSERFG